MGTVESLKPEPPTPGSVARDAIGSVLDRFCVDVMSEVEATERAIQALGQLALSNTAQIKAQLENMVATAALLKEEAQRVNTVVEDLRAKHARLIGSEP